MLYHFIYIPSLQLKIICFNGLIFRSQVFHVRHSHSFTLISKESFIYYFLSKALI